MKIRKSIRYERIIIMLIALVFLGSVIVYLLSTEDTADIVADHSSTRLQIVSFERVPVEPQRIEIVAFSQVNPRWSANLTAAVSGRVLDVTDKALAGEPVAAGTVLLHIEPSQYEAEVASAKVALQEAELALWNAKNASHLAQEQFNREGKTAPNDLALKLPQLQIATDSVALAQARLKSAEQQLAYTTVSAPFSGFVTERHVSPGQSIGSGETLVHLVDDKVFELEVELDRRDWSLLPRPQVETTARVLDQSGAEIGRAQVRRAGGFLDDKTRLYKIFLEVNAADNPAVLAGDFVQVALTGRIFERAMSIPEGALTQEGYVWHLDKEDRLQRLTPVVLFRREGRIIIEAPDEPRAPARRIATTPLASFLPGQRAEPAETTQP